MRRIPPSCFTGAGLLHSAIETLLCNLPNERTEPPDEEVIKVLGKHNITHGGGGAKKRVSVNEESPKHQIKKNSFQGCRNPLSTAELFTQAYFQSDCLLLLQITECK